jgi:hypothetical protein
MAEYEWDKKTERSLSNPTLTASQYLLFYSDEYNLMSDITADTSKNTLSGGFTLVPRDDSLPSARLSAEGGVNQRPSATLSVGNQLLNFESRFEDVPPQQGGDVFTSTLSGKAGPFRAFYSEIGQPGNQDLEQTNIGGSWNIGPAELFARRTRSRQEVVDPLLLNTGQDTEIDTIGAHGSLPLGRGMVSGGVDRQFVTSRYPQHISQESRPMAQAPNVTNYQGGWKGPVGPGILALQAALKDVRNVGMEPSAKAKYTYKNPLGWGGELSATGSYVNPLDPNRESEARFRVAYGRKF